MTHPKAERLQGVMTAIITPFAQGGRLALEAVPDLLAFQRQAGIDGVIVCGTNGEGLSLSVAERQRMLEAVMAHREGLTVVAATGATSLTDALDLTRHAGEVGADATLILPPCFFKNPTVQGLADYFRPLLDAAPLPALLYHIPQISAVPITDELLALLADHPNLAGIKDSTGDWSGTHHFITRWPTLQIFAGSDRLAAKAATGGAAGSISGGANPFPEVIVGVRNAHRAGADTAAAQQRIDVLIEITSRCPLIAVSKSILAHRGLPRLAVRPPLIDLTVAQEASLIAELRTAGLL